MTANVDPSPLLHGPAGLVRARSSAASKREWPDAGTPGGVRRGRVRACVPIAAVVLFAAAFAGPASAQRLRFVTGYREIAPPDYASMRLGPFYSNLRFVQTVGMRYSASTTNIVDLSTGSRKGVFKKDGFEIPMISTLALRNYLPISKNADLDASVSCSYAYYPMKTQEDQFSVNLAEKGITAAFEYAMNYQNRLSPNFNLTAYERPSYSLDYVDVTGRIDEFGGEAYQRLQNAAGIKADYLVSRNQALAVDVSRNDVWPQVSAFSNQKSTTYNTSAAYQWEVNPKLDTGVRASFVSGSYPNSKQGGYLSQSYSLFAGADVTRHIKGSASLGYSLSGVAATPESTQADSGTLIGSLALAMELSKRMSHNVSFSRTQRRGFESGLETSDGLTYALSWNGDFMAVTFNAGANRTGVEFGDTSGYSSRNAGMSVAMPVSPEVTVTISTDYSIRDGGKAEGGTDAAPELTSDYDTLVSRISTGWEFMRDLSVTAYGQYANRGSVNSSMRYEQYMFGADCGYSYEF